MSPVFPRLRVLLGVFCLPLLLISRTHSAEVVGPPQVAAGPGGSMIVRWTTDVPTGTRITYGLSATRLNQSAEAGVTAAHEVTLNGLQAGTQYFFAVGTARKQLTTGQFTTASSSAAATAPPSSSPASVPPATPKPKFFLAKILAPPSAAPPTRETWGSLASLPDHFNRHGRDFGATSPDDYARRAWEFRQRARAGQLLVKVDGEGVQRVFDPATGAFAAYNRDGTTKTFFKPGSRDYFDRQPGQLVKAATP